MTLKIVPPPLLPHRPAATAPLRSAPTAPLRRAPSRIDLRHLMSGSLLIAVTPFLSVKSTLAEVGVSPLQQLSVGANDTHPDNNSDEIALPPNGDFAVFSSDATNILPPGQDTNGARDLFLLNKVGVSLLSVAPDGQNMGANSTLEQAQEQQQDPNYRPDVYPAVSRVLPDGTYGVTFTSSAINMLPAGVNNPGGPDLYYDQVYLRIPKLGKTVLISGNPSTQEAGNGPSFGSAITAVAGPNRFLIVFTSCATNLDSTIPSPGGPGGKRLYLAKVDLSGSEPKVSLSLLGGQELIRPAVEEIVGRSIPDFVPLVYLSQVDFDNPAISGDGSTVAFTIESRFGVEIPDFTLPPFPAQVFRFLVNKGNPPEAISLPAASDQQTGDFGNDASVHPSLSYDGKRVAFSTKAANLNVNASSDQPKFVLWKESDNSLIPINKTANGTLSNGTGLPLGTISPDGRYALWSDNGNNLVEGDTNGVSDIFLKSLDDNTIQRISKTSNGELNAESFHPAIGAPSSANELRMAFVSRATNLGTTGSPNVSRIFGSKSLSLPEPTIKKNAPITIPPEVTVGKKRSITLRFLKFRLPSPSKWTTNSSAEMEAFMAAATRGKITYEIISNIKTRKRFDRIQSRNRVTLQQVKPGTYYVSYRAIAQIGKKRIVTKKSPVARFTIK